MFRIRITPKAATIERAKLFLARGGALLLCVLLVPIAAHASPFDSGISSLQTLFTGYLKSPRQQLQAWADSGNICWTGESRCWRSTLKSTSCLTY